MLLQDYCFYSKDKTSIATCNVNNYISTENMCPNKRGVQPASKLPEVEFVSAYKPNDVLISNIRPYFKKIYFAKNSGGCSNDVLVMRANENTYPKFLYYLLSQQDFFDYSTKSSKGTKMPRGDKNAIMHFNCPTFIYEDQIAIADVLSSFDDKIELNNKIIKNLEDQAQSLYKHWFVDFEFPNEEGKPYKSSGGKFKESELGLIPECWECNNIGDVCTRLTKRVKDGKCEVLSAINTGELVLSSDYFNKQVFSENISNYIIVPPFSFAYNPARANIGSIGMNKFNFDGCVSPIYIAVTFKKDYHWFWEILIKSEYFKEQIKTRSSGSVRQNFDFNSFSTIKIIYPDANTILNFNSYYETLNNQIVKIKNENKKLEETRDYLLQKLMKGEVKVGN